MLDAIQDFLVMADCFHSINQFRSELNPFIHIEHTCSNTQKLVVPEYAEVLDIFKGGRFFQTPCEVVVAHIGIAEVRLD